MTSPPLVPRPRAAPLVSVDQTPLAPPTPKQWVVLYPEIKRLYIHERKTLRYIVQYVEKEHGLKATQQMYKKRFAKWGFQKNAKHSAGVVPMLTKDKHRRKENGEHDEPRQLTSLPSPLGHSYDDGLMLRFLYSVRVCGMAFFEPMHSGAGYLTSQGRRYSIDMSWDDHKSHVGITLGMAMELLNRGNGILAGRMVRKAFLLAEDMLSLEGPVFVWNLLEMMHHMVTQHHSRLFLLLLVHLTALIDSRLPQSHPIPAMLCRLQELFAHLTRLEKTTLRKNSSLCLSPGEKGWEARSNDTSFDTLSPLLERAWTLNAEIVFANLDPRLFPLYCRIQWTWGSITPPTTIVATANAWFRHLEAHPSASHISDKAHHQQQQPDDDGRFNGTPVSMQGEHHDHLPAMDLSSPPLDYETVSIRSITELRKHRDSICTDASTGGLTADTTTWLRILVVLVTAQALERWVSEEVVARMRFVKAEVVALAMRILMNIKAAQQQREGDADGFKPPSAATIDRLRYIVALREYAHGAGDPRAVQDLWMLVDALTTSGRYKEARELEQMAYLRLERFVHDISLSAA